MTPDETPVEAILKKLKARFAEADEEKVAPAQREKKTAVSVKAPRPADDHAVMSARKSSLCPNFGLSARSGMSPPAGT